MTAQSAIPQKWYVPFANGDTARVELPVTTSDPTRASQTLGFPPLTMQPPESGGVPPQGEDFNGGMNQVARICWWVLNGGGWPYDSSFATNSNILGYPNGAKLQSADLRGDWISVADNNQNNPDTNGNSWVPGFQYGSTALTGLTGGTVTPTPAQAAKSGISVAGALTSALTIVLPNWTKNWTITNNTTGAFVTIVKTAAGSGVTIPQNGLPTRVSGDGTNITQLAENVPVTSSTTGVPQMSQVAGVVGNARNVRSILGTASQSTTFTADEVIVETALGGVRYCLPSFSQTINIGASGAGGMMVGTAPASGFVAIYAIYNPTTGAASIGGAVATTGLRSPEVFGGVLPSGYTASALLAIWPTNASSQFITASWLDRTLNRSLVSIYSAATAPTTLTGVVSSTFYPFNAVRVNGSLQVFGTSTAGYYTYNLAANANGDGLVYTAGQLAVSGAVGAPFSIPVTSQSIFHSVTLGGTATATGATFAFGLSGYTI